MAKKYVILHEPVATARPPQPARHGGFPGGAGRGMEAFAASLSTTAPRVEIATLAPAEARDLVQTKKVTSIAPVMPMKLIAPVKISSIPVAARAGTPAWGIEAVGALTSPFDGAGIVVAVLDTGIDPTHPAFMGVELERHNFTNTGPDDEHGHGTHCAGTIFGRPVDGIRIGVAPGVSKVLIGKVLGGDGGGSDQIAQAIQWAINGGAHVISMSLGIDFPGYVKQLIDDNVPLELATSMALEGYRANILLFERLASFVAARGMLAQPTLLVAAAGNESRREQRSDFEIAVSPPAVADGFVSVAALDRTPAGLVVAPFSNTGARISGPGVDIVSARAGGGLVSMDGTSMATPHVAGVAALWAQKLYAQNDLNEQEWTTRLLGSGIRTGFKAGFDPSDIGGGIVQARASALAHHKGLMPSN